MAAAESKQRVILFKDHGMVQIFAHVATMSTVRFADAEYAEALQEVGFAACFVPVLRTCLLPEVAKEVICKTMQIKYLLI